MHAPLEVADLVAELLLGAPDGRVNLVRAAVVHRDREAVLRHVEREVLRTTQHRRVLSQKQGPHLPGSAVRISPAPPPPPNPHHPGGHASG